MNARPLLLLATLLLPLGCGDRDLAPPPAVKVNAGLATATVTIGGKPFTLEIADTEPKREVGLMNRDAMPAGHGMLFVFQEVKPRAFWMKNTRIPLDILYLDSSGKIVSVGHMRPFDLNDTPSGGPILYAIELNAGAAAGLSAGDRIDLSPALAGTSGKN